MGYTPSPSSGGGGVSPLSWSPIPLGTNSSNFGEPYDHAEYAEDGIGMVYLRGVIDLANAGENMVLGTMPEAVWPKKRKLITIRDGNTVSVSALASVETNGEIVLLSIASDGEFTPSFYECHYDLQA